MSPRGVETVPPEARQGKVPDLESAWLDPYVDAWVLHAVAGTTEGSDELKAFLDRVSPDVRYEDVPSAAVFTGHAGIKEMCEAAHGWFS